MGEFSDETETETAATAMHRRGLLKGAAAAGVGVVAWGTPSITSLGGTPVYAAVCTAPVTTTIVSVRNTACGGCPTTINFKPVQTAQCTNPFAFPVQVGTGTVGPGCVGFVAAGNDGVCPPPAQNGGVCVGGTPPGQKCKVKVVIQAGNCSGTIHTTAVSAIFTGKSFVTFPNTASGGGPLDCSNPLVSSNSFTRIEIVCSTQAACLP